MKEEVQAIDEEHQKMFAGGSRIAITIDSCSSKNANCSLLAITGHVVTDKLQSQNVLIGCAAFDDTSHTASATEKKVREALSRISIPAEKIAYMVSDGASVMVSAADKLNVKRIHCCAHVIHPIVRDALENTGVSSIIKRTKKTLDEMELPKAIPSTDCPTKWSSTYTMICDVLNSLPAFEKLISYLKMPSMEDDEESTLKMLRTFLEPFYTMTNQT
ncbi:hypothetical protein Aduo_015641 [Ancylostoma duodenale]